MNLMKTHNGFTLVELLIVVAVVAILAAVAFVAIDPAARLNESQDGQRWTSANALLDAFLQSTVDHDGTYPAGITANGAVHMISTTTGTCAVSHCSDAVTICTDFSALTTDGYIPSLPTDPDGTSKYGVANGGTGYTLSISTTGVATVKACGAEEDPIQVSR